MRKNPRPTLLLNVLMIALCFSPIHAQAATESLESTIKKIIMMMNIVGVEYEAGIVDGKIVNAAEYEESKVFLQQSENRFKRLPAPKAGAEATAPLLANFTDLAEKIQSKVDAAEVYALVNTINAGIKKAYDIKISQTPANPVSLANGKTIFENKCAVCHGLTGKGDGPIAAQLDPAPAVLADPQLTGDDHTVAFDNFQVINVGIANTAMVGWADFLSEQDLWDVTYYVRSFSNENVKLPLITAGLAGADGVNEGDGSKQAAAAVAESRNLLDTSLEIFKKGDIQTAADTAFDAYLAYEGIEAGLISKKKELGLRLESAFSRYQGEIKRQAALPHVEKIHATLHTDLSEALEILQKKVSFTGLFIQSFSIIVREGFEAILIIAALIAFLVKSRNQDKLKSIYTGVILGIVGSFLTAYVVHEVLHLSVSSQELLEGWIMLVAVVVLFWVSYWLVSKIEAEKWQSYITKKMKTAVSTGSAFALGGVAFLSVYREGFETVLFYKALYLYAGEGTAGIIPGFLVGCAVLGVVYYLINKVGLKVPIKWFFAFTSVFLYFMAFTFMGKGLHELQMGQSLSMTQADFAPHISWLGMYPTWETFIGQMVLVLAYVAALVYTFGIKPEVETEQLKKETSHIQKDITVVHDLVEHISHHAKRCEIFLKDTKDQDLKELSGHLKEIDEKIHELFDHVSFVENRLHDEFEKLGQRAMPAEGKKGLS
ncbi:MAG: cystathionine gamma-synthase [Nitrospinaceae bacterium]|nr:MAG: cystathionine gamma-synthase [Nitrospinaceae bacterium]